MGNQVMKIPVAFTDASNSMKNLISEFRKQLALVKPGTNTFRGLENQIKAMEKLQGRTEQKINMGTTTERGIDNLTNSLDSLNNMAENVRNAFQALGDTNFSISKTTFGDLGDQLLDVNAQLTQTRTQLNNLKKMKISELMPGNLAVEKYGNKNADSAQKQISAELANTTSRWEEATQAANEYRAEVERIRNLKVDSQALAMGRITNPSGSNKDGTASGIEYRERLLEHMQTNFVSKNRSGNMAFSSSKSRDAASQFLASMGMDADTLTQLMSGNLRQSWERISQELSGGVFGVKNFKKSFFENAREQNLGGIEEAETNHAAQDALPGMEQQLAAMDAQITKRETEINNLRDAAQQIIDALKTAGVEGLEANEATLAGQVQQLQQQIGEIGRSQVNAGPAEMPDYHAARDVVRQGAEAAQQAEDFQKQLKNSMAQWMGASQIIGLIKDGIRTAYQDIKNLDTTMANMAVVTDLSISDLWGRINEYMSVAQQYGVTTQGVYEVMQLYTQQGLDLNTSMVLTTETLKMARQQSHL